MKIEFEYIDNTPPRPANMSMYSRVTNKIYFIVHFLGLPIIIIHELSHFLMGLVLGALPETLTITCRNSRVCAYEVYMNYPIYFSEKVYVQKLKGIRNVLISIAPIIPIMIYLFLVSKIYNDITDMNSKVLIVSIGLIIHYIRFGYFISKFDFIAAGENLKHFFTAEQYIPSDIVENEFGIEESI